MEFVPFVTLETLGNTKALGRMFHDIEEVAGTEGRVGSTFLGNKLSTAVSNRSPVVWVAQHQPT